MTLPPLSDAPLALSRAALRILRRLNLVFGAMVLLLLAASLVRGDAVARALGVRIPAEAADLRWGMRAIMVIGVLATPLTHRIFSRLLDIVDTVALGDPFVHANAERLQTIAWSVLALESLHVAVGLIAAGVSAAGHPLGIGWTLSVTRVLVIPMLFLLARVFDQGTRMRDDLATTI